MQKNHIDVLIFLSLSSVSRCYNINFKTCVTLEVLTSTDTMLRVQDTSEKHVAVGVAGYMVNGSYFPSVFSLISTDETKHQPNPFGQGFKLRTCDSS